MGISIEFIILIPILLFSLSLHEYAHGRMAYQLGDPTPKNMGRLTLNPLAHLSLLGTLVLLVTRLFGWAKPVRIDPRYFANPRKGMMYVSLAGPISNILLAIVLALVFRFFRPSLILLASPRIVDTVLVTGVTINIGLAFFNLIPLPPLDGSKVLRGVLPRSYDQHLNQLEAYGPFILLAIIYFGGFRYFLIPIIRILQQLLLGFTFI